MRPPSGLGLASCGGRWRIEVGSTTGGGRGEARDSRAVLPLPSLSSPQWSSSSLLLVWALFRGGGPINPDAGPACRTFFPLG